MSVLVERSRFLDLRALAALEHTRFVTRHQIEGAYSGRHRSRQQGGAAEFVDYREYSAGEDIRRLDWKVLARTGRPYIRLFQNETNLSCMMVIDASGSMLFGGVESGNGRPSSARGEALTPALSRSTGRGRDGGSKLEYVQYLSTAFSHVISKQQDQVGVAVVADGLRELLPPGSMGSHVMRVQETIAGIETAPVTDLEGSLRDLFSRLSRRGVLMIMSDFLVDDLERTFGAIRLFRHRRWDVICLHVIHPEEERLPEGLAYRFEGLENDGRVDCSPAEVRRAYEERFAAHAAAVRTLALAGGCDYRRVSTKVGYLQTLGTFLVERSG